LNFVKGVVFR